MKPDPEDIPDVENFERFAVKRMADLAPNFDAPALSLVFNVVRLANRIVGDIESQVHSQAGWSWAGFRIMFVTFVFGELEPREISRLADVSRASVSSVLNTLERDNMVVRLRESHDRRLVTVRLTEQGEKDLLETFAAHNQREQDWSAALKTTEVEQLTSLVRKMLADGPVERGIGNTD